MTLPKVKRYRLSYKYGVVSADGDLQHSPDCSEPMVCASDFDQYKAAVALLRKHVRHSTECSLGTQRGCSCGASAALRDTEVEG